MHTYIHTYVYIYIYIYICVCLWIYIYMCVCVCMCTCIQTNVPISEHVMAKKVSMFSMPCMVSHTLVDIWAAPLFCRNDSTSMKLMENCRILIKGLASESVATTPQRTAVLKTSYRPTVGPACVSMCIWSCMSIYVRVCLSVRMSMCTCMYACTRNEWEYQD